MTKHSLTTTAAKIIESEDEDRKYLFSVGEFSTAVAVYVRIGDIGDPDFVLSDEGTSALVYHVPAQRPVYAWTDAGTAKLCTALLKE